MWRNWEARTVQVRVPLGRGATVRRPPPAPRRHDDFARRFSTLPRRHHLPQEWGATMRVRADVAELVDAHGSGPCALRGVEVQVLSSALLPRPGRFIGCGGGN